MTLFSFFEQKKVTKIKIILFLDAGKGNARGAVVEMRNKVPHILYAVSGERKIGLPESKESLSLAMSSLEEVLEDIARALQKPAFKNKEYVAEDVYCILAEPYYLSHTSVITETYSGPFTITPGIIKKLINSYHELLPETHKEVLLDSDPDTIHERIIEIRVNGYHTDNPYGMIANELQLAVFRTKINKKIVNLVTKIVRKITPAPLSIEPLSLAAFITVRNKVDTNKDFILVTVGNDVSEISLIKEHTLLETVSFPFGKHSLARLIASKISATAEEALTRLGLYHDKKLSKQSAESFFPVMEETQSLWFSYLEKSLVSLSEEVSIPENIYIFVDTDLKDMLGSNITQKDFASQTLVPHGFIIKTLDASSLSEQCTFGLNIRFDSILAIAASFAAASKEVINEEVSS
ncbi:MAG: hypothetical protein AAB513_00985 [Patescibacteria group bacterium]